MPTAIIPCHLHLDDLGRAWIDDTNTKVIEVALSQIAHGWDAAELHEQYPHLYMAQIHAALSHYHDHKAEYDAEIERQSREHVASLALERDSPLRRKLRAAGQIP